jgi:hypothetical protein
MRRLVCAAMIFAVSVPAFAEDTAHLPPSAKRLAGATIAALYDGAAFTFKSQTFYGLVIGEVSYDFTTGTNHGTYALGFRKGTFDGKIRIAGDRFCYRAGSPRERCNYVYVDGADIYEVRQSGIVDSVKRRK